MKKPLLELSHNLATYRYYGKGEWERTYSNDRWDRIIPPHVPVPVLFRIIEFLEAGRV